jgi:pyruvate/2-oxoglutarate/acetoin dehydrogenase E1 component/TPP-dependent pyruvate/acetoin dehydrogenase alpha subunit
MPDLNLPYSLDAKDVIQDYRLAYKSRQASVIGRREALGGKAQFGIFGDGKEVVQLAIARAFQKGDWRSGYYRDQTWIFALGAATIQEFFAQLFAHKDVEADPNSAGRNMNSHFGNRYINPDGTWIDQTEVYNVASDIPPTASQMPRLVGLAFASNIYREVDELRNEEKFSRNGNEIAWGSIGNASTAEGPFWETVNAIGVLKSPSIISIYDDGYGISVPNQFQMVKENIYAILSGFQRDPCPAKDCDRGYDLYQVEAWDYPALLEVYQKAASIAREHHIPSLIHVTEVTQPLGHSTSGSHERYKSKERLAWEEEFDCLVKMRAWMVENQIAADEQLTEWEKEDRKTVEKIREAAWEARSEPILDERGELIELLNKLASESQNSSQINQIKDTLTGRAVPFRRDNYVALHSALEATRTESLPARQALIRWKQEQDPLNQDRISSHLYSSSGYSAVDVKEVKPVYSDDSPTMSAFEILNACFDAILEREPRFIAFGEDVGQLGAVNQAFRGLQEKYGDCRVMDTGIREATILGQATGMAMRGLRPLCEIQYLDYLHYALQTLSDDLATLHWRTKGGQKAPVIIRTRGHRLVGIFHSGSLMAGLIHLARGMNVLVPRNAVRASGFYNTLLVAEEPGIIIEVLNAYRLKETLPDNISEITTPVGVPEILREGTDITVVTYGAMCRLVMEAADKLSQAGIEVEVIDVQSLLPFDINGLILESLKKTNRILFTDEDVPGGTTAYMMAEVIEKQGGYFWLDSPPRTLPGKPHRPAYGQDGDYWSKPSVEDIFDTVYEIMHEVRPDDYPAFYG